MAVKTLSPKLTLMKRSAHFLCHTIRKPELNHNATAKYLNLSQICVIRLLMLTSNSRNDKCLVTFFT